MAKFTFGNYDPTEEEVVFATNKLYTEPASETETRKQLSAPLIQLKDFINTYLNDDGKITLSSLASLDASDIEVDDSNFTRLQGYNVQDVLEAADLLSLPIVDSTDNGKILKVTDGEWAAGDSDLPSVSAADNGKVLKVVSGQWKVGYPSGEVYLQYTVFTGWESQTIGTSTVYAHSYPNDVIDADVIVVTFNGTEYRVEKTEVDPGMSGTAYYYGDMTFATYPFVIYFASNTKMIYKAGPLSTTISIAKGV